MERIPEQEAIAEMEAAQRYNQVMGRGLIQQEYRKLAEAVISRNIPEGGKVLDLGTGPGFVALEIASRLRGKALVVGLDLSPAMLALATQNAIRRGLDSGVAWRQGDAKEMPFPDDEFDFVVSSGSLHHWEEPLPVFNEIARVLKPNGGCLIRDSKRLGAGGARLFAWAIGLTLPADFRQHYWGSIRSSYTAAELQDILSRSHLQSWRIEEDLMDFAVVR
jgi:ubiquinone/menaquinone biosynthesis C-methylase UbiE